MQGFLNYCIIPFVTKERNYMKHFEYTPHGVCSRLIKFDLDDNNCLHNVSFLGGCPGNLKAIGKLIEGKDAKEIQMILAGNQCGPRPTSCADQLSKAINEALTNN